MCLGLQALYDVDAVHRDLKPENVLMKYSLNEHSDNESKPIVKDDLEKYTITAKLGDLGLSKVLNEYKEQMKSILGTQLYMAPEILKGEPYTRAVEVWSLGVILFEMYTMDLPYTGNDNDDLLKSIC